MSDKKELKRLVKAVWAEVKKLRTERAKLYAPDEIATSAEQLGTHSAALLDLATRMSALSAMPPTPDKIARAKRRRERSTKED